MTMRIVENRQKTAANRKKCGRKNRSSRFQAINWWKSENHIFLLNGNFVVVIEVNRWPIKVVEIIIINFTIHLIPFEQSKSKLILLVNSFLLKLLLSSLSLSLSIIVGEMIIYFSACNVPIQCQIKSGGLSKNSFDQYAEKEVKEAEFRV